MHHPEPCHSHDARHGDHKLNPQVDLLPLLGGENADYNALIAEEAGVKKEDVISSDMFLYPRQHGVVFGMENEFIASRASTTSSARSPQRKRF